MKSIIIRRANLKDFYELYELLNKIPELSGGVEEKSYTTEWIKSTIKDRKRNIALIAEENHKIVGFLLAELWADKKDSFFIDIYVKPEYRNRGIANNLRKNYENRLKDLGIGNISAIVLKSNKAMQKIIEKYNYEKGGLFYFYRKHLK